MFGEYCTTCTNTCSTTTQLVQLDSRLQEASLIMDPKVLRIGMAVNIQRSDGKPWPSLGFSWLQVTAYYHLAMAMG